MTDDKAKQTVLDFIWAKTHSDFKGTLNGERTVLVLRNGGTTLVPLTGLTLAEIADKMPWPKDAATGKGKRMGDMPLGEQRARTALATLKIAAELTNPEIAKIIAA